VEVSTTALLKLAHAPEKTFGNGFAFYIYEKPTVIESWVFSAIESHKRLASKE
jgi:hypothetical protein